jgi:methylthioribose-1-phosphate isomerase
VHVYSKPHNLEANLPIVSMNLNLATASKTVTIGTIERRDISEIIGPEGQGYSETIIQQSNLVYDPTPTRGSNNAVTSSGIYEALGDIRFTVNADRTIHVEQVK